MYVLWHIVTRMDRMPRWRSPSGILSMRVTLYPIGNYCSSSNRFRIWSYPRGIDNRSRIYMKSKCFLSLWRMDSLHRYFWVCWHPAIDLFTCALAKRGVCLKNWLDWSCSYKVHLREYWRDRKREVSPVYKGRGGDKSLIKCFLFFIYSLKFSLPNLRMGNILST